MEDARALNLKRRALYDVVYGIDEADSRMPRYELASSDGLLVLFFRRRRRSIFGRCRGHFGGFALPLFFFFLLLG